MPAPRTGTAAIAPFVLFAAALLVPVDVPVDEPVDDPLFDEPVDIVEPPFTAAPVVVELTAFAVALPAVITTGLYIVMASAPVNVVVSKSPDIFTPEGKDAPVPAASAVAEAKAAPCPDDDTVHAAYEVPEREQSRDADAYAAISIV